KYYLDQDINFSSLTNVVLSGVLVLCLNGKNINNAYFSGADIIITNCTNTVSKMTDPSDEHRLFNGNTYVYGMNKNINLNTDMLIETVTTNGASLFYDVDITSPDNSRIINTKSVIAPTDGLNLILENITAKNLAHTYTFFNLNLKDNVTVAVKNSTFDGLKSDISTFLFMNDVHQGSTLNFYGDNHFTNCEAGLSPTEYDAPNRIEAIITIRRSDMYVHDGTTTIENNISRGRSVLLESVHDTANIEIKDGANLILNNNQIHMQSVTTCAMYINNRFRLYGNLSITNNKIINCGTNNSVDISSFYYLHTSQAIPVGNSKIIVSGNTSDGDEKTYPKQHVFQVLAHRTAGLFSQETGTELDTNSRMTVSFVGNVAGTIMSDWNHSDANAFDTIFKADKFFDNEFLIVKDQNKAVRVMTHGHKICGYSSLEECDHRGIASHSEIFSYAAFFGGATLTDTQKVSKLRAGGSYRLDADLVLSGPTNVNLNADLYLCLNGKTLNNVVFDSSEINNHKVYITNCKKESATIRRETGAAWFITNYKDASVMAPHKNINLVNSNRMKNDTGTANKLDLYGVTFSQDPKGDILLALISTVAGGSEINLSNVNISNYDINDVNYALIDVAGSNANKATLNIYESSFEKNNDKRNYHYRNNIIYASHCNTGIYDTVFKNNSCPTVFTNINSGSSKFQNVEFVNNETLADVINLTGTTNDFDNVNVSNNKRAVTQNTAIIDVTNNAVLNVKAGGLKVNKNTQVIGAVDCIWLGDDGVLNVEEGATLEIKENIFTHTSISTAMPAYSMILGNEGAS
ncbi:MAG: hypothetical protein II411_00970, partial [Lachnospiraceae bacterium]|nr:hypothetical protein [Lachnospiraceae bacterium]